MCPSLTPIKKSTHVPILILGGDYKALKAEGKMSWKMHNHTPREVEVSIQLFTPVQKVSIISIPCENVLL